MIRRWRCDSVLVCMCATIPASFHSLQPFVAGSLRSSLVVKPLATAALRVSSPSSGQRASRRPGSGHGYLKPTVASSASSANHLLETGREVPGVLCCAQNWNETWLVSHHTLSGWNHSMPQEGRRGEGLLSPCWLSVGLHHSDAALLVNSEYDGMTTPLIRDQLTQSSCVVFSTWWYLLLTGGGAMRNGELARTCGQCETFRQVFVTATSGFN